MKTITFCFVLCMLAALSAGAQDRSTPEAEVCSFLMAFERGDIKHAAACVKGV